MLSRRDLFATAALLSALSFSTASVALEAACFSGVWVMDKKLSNADTAPMALVAPFGDNGWIRAGANEGPMRFASGETRLVVFNGRVYTIFGTDPREVVEVDNGKYAMDSSPEGALGENTSTIRFTEDCMHMDASPSAEEKRIFDKLLPPGASAMTPSGPYHGLWIMNRQASAMTRPGTEDAPSKNEEFVVIAPWGNNGWGYNVVSGGYQPADLLQRGMKAPIRPRRYQRLQQEYLATMQPLPRDYDYTIQRETYYATWNGTPAYTNGSYPRQVTVRKIDDRRFEMEFAYIHQPWLAAVGNVRSTVVFSNDGKRMTATSSGIEASGERFQNDVRVYDKADPATWPSKESRFPPR
jgi:hypothetical protein